MRHLGLLSVTTLVTLAACSSEDNLTQPGTDPAASVAAISTPPPNTWALRAAPQIGVYAASAGAAKNAAGQWVVYKFGGTDGQGGTGWPVQAYNVATNTWTIKSSRVGVFHSNGVGKIGNRLYFSGGSPEFTTPSSYSNQLWAYDYTNDRMILRASLPIFSGEGVSGVVNNKLYVLPGICSGEAWPNPGYCAENMSRRFYRYDPGTNSWASRPDAPHFHRFGAAGVLNGKLYVVGGYSDESGTKVASLDVYDPAANSWKTLRSIPGGGGGAKGSVIGGRFFVVSVGGSYAYIPATDRWVSRASPSLAHDEVVTVSLNGAARLMAVGGSHGPESDVPNRSEIYTP